MAVRPRTELAHARPGVRPGAMGDAVRRTFASRSGRAPLHADDPVRDGRCHVPPVSRVPESVVFASRFPARGSYTGTVRRAVSPASAVPDIRAI